MGTYYVQAGTKYFMGGVISFLFHAMEFFFEKSFESAALSHRLKNQVMMQRAPNLFGYELLESIQPVFLDAKVMALNLY